ncbi:hypothetical protein BDR07DRAFT_1478229 [Suillus spraguei]|nr:hypothetical protein BDR07DRAFT_1478229 [Suillus spraguei]
MNAKNYSTEKPIVLVMGEQERDVIDDILSIRCSLGRFDNVLCLTIDREAIIVPDQCHDQLHLLLHHLRIYQLTAKTFLEYLNNTNTHQIYVAIVYYYCEVLLAFCQEVKVDDPCSNKTWRSAHLDYHFALALENNAFSKDMQETALSKINRSWGNFQRKTVYLPVQQPEMVIEIVQQSINSTPTVVEGETSETNVLVDRVPAISEVTTERTIIHDVGENTEPIRSNTHSYTTSDVEEDGIEVYMSEMKD